MDYFPRKSLSKYLVTDTIDFNKHVHNVDIFINDKWRKYGDGDIRRLFKITRRLELRFWPTRKRSQPSQGDFFVRIALQREPWMHVPVKWFFFNFFCSLIPSFYDTLKKEGADFSDPDATVRLKFVKQVYKFCSPDLGGDGLFTDVDYKKSLKIQKG